MKLEVNISKAKFFSILGAVLVLAGALFAYAYWTNSPSVFGHSIQEVDGITCTAGQAITRDTTGLWKCVASNCNTFPAIQQDCGNVLQLEAHPAVMHGKM